MGCGAAPDFPPADIQVGLDIDFPALLRSRSRYPYAYLVCGDGECLPFRDAAFDAVTSRVALPLMNLNAAIPELSRVLKPGGHATLNLHHLGFACRDLLRRVRTGRPKAIVGGLWGIVNGFIFHCFGRTLRLPFSRRSYDSFQTYSAMSRILRKEGFSGPVIQTYVFNVNKAENPAVELGANKAVH